MPHIINHIVLCMPQPEKNARNLDIFKDLNKPVNKPESYKSICCAFFSSSLKGSSTIGSKTISKKRLPLEQTGFRHGRGTVELVALMTNIIEYFFDKKKKVGAVLVDL